MGETGGVTRPHRGKGLTTYRLITYRPTATVGVARARDAVVHRAGERTGSDLYVREACMGMYGSGGGQWDAWQCRCEHRA